MFWHKCMAVIQSLFTLMFPAFRKTGKDYYQQLSLYMREPQIKLLWQRHNGRLEMNWRTTASNFHSVSSTP